MAFIGRTPNAERVYVSIRLEEKDGRPFNTTAHEHIPGNYTELAITGELVAFKGRSVMAIGQIINYAASVSPDEFSYWSQADIRSLVKLWRRWHLNGMQAGCEHMELPADQRYEAR
jgi:hypothetical protein